MKKKSRFLSAQFWAFYTLMVPVIYWIAIFFGFQFNIIHLIIILCSWILVGIVVLILGEKEARRIREVESKLINDDLEILDSES
jgi:hypothetical protein